MHNMCLYAQFLAYFFKTEKAIRNYLNAVKTLHILAQVEPPDLKDIEMSITMKGLKKKLARSVKRVQPLTPEILKDILAQLNLEKYVDIVFWAMLLIGFFAMLCKSNMVSDTIEGFDPIKQLTRGHIEFIEEIAIIKVTWAKNIQNQEKLLEIPLFSVAGSVLCPVATLKWLLSMKGKKHYLLFGKGNKPLFTYSKFQKKLKKYTKKGWLQTRSVQ